jgi:hypothetical protein
MTAQAGIVRNLFPEAYGEYSGCCPADMAHAALVGKEGVA